jgi:thioredoxin 1
MPVLHIKNTNQFNTLISKRVIIKYTATWCGPCRMIAPFFAECANDPHYSSILFAEIDVDELPDLVKQQNITSVPTFHAWCSGIMVDQFVGPEKNKLKTLITKIL